MYNNITIIIPTIIVNNQLLQCIEKIRKISSKIKIIILFDKKTINAALSKYKNIKLIFLKKKFTISKKRNLGVKKSKTKYIGFIDSDAYPDKNWIKNSLNVLKNNKEIFLVGGPNISPIGQSISKRLISEVQKSFLISGKWSFQKSVSHSRFTENLYSCNMIMEKKYYLIVKGMDEKLVTGEDYDFCQRIKNIGGKVFFNMNSIVYHHDRSFKNFFFQKIIRGYTISNQIKNRALVFNKNKYSFYTYQLVPFYFFIFSCLSTLYFLFYGTEKIINSLLISIYTVYLILIFISLKISTQNLLLIPKVVILIIFGNLLIGLGSLISFLGFDEVTKFYKNY